MNYRHHFHAGNFADVFKHALLVALVRAMQRKPKGFLFLDTHAGRGGYELGATLPGREPEWTDGIGRLWGAVSGLPAELADYVALVRAFDGSRSAVAAAGAPRFYPGSPWLVQLAARPQDRLALVELREDDAEALSTELGGQRRVSVQRMDGYTALKALLPPPERRALVLVDPPFEDKDEFAAVAAGLGEALRRFPGGTYAVWYPLTERAGAGRFHDAVRALAPPPTFCAEFEPATAGDATPRRMKGCGLLIVNPPWQFERVVETVLPVLARRLGASETGWSTQWLVPETGS